MHLEPAKRNAYKRSVCERRNGSYDSLTIFRQIDKDNKGWVNADDLNNYF